MDLRGLDMAQGDPMLRVVLTIDGLMMGVVTRKALSFAVAERLVRSIAEEISVMTQGTEQCPEIESITVTCTMTDGVLTEIMTTRDCKECLILTDTEVRNHLVEIYTLFGREEVLLHKITSLAIIILTITLDVWCQALTFAERKIL